MPSHFLARFAAVLLTVGLAAPATAQSLAPGTCDPAIASCVGPNGGGASCPPAKGGATCDGSGPASQAGGGGNVGAGNPINVLTGNKYQREVDMPPLPGFLGLELVRHYNSHYSHADVPTGILGRGWRLSYETELRVAGDTLQILQADGSRLIFNRDRRHPHRCSTREPARGRLLILGPPGQEEYVWHWATGRQLHFNHQGRLVQILAPSGEAVHLAYDPRGLLLRVTDPQGRSLQLHYGGKAAQASGENFHGVTAIESPVGRFDYGYGSTAPAGSALASLHLAANLVSVTPHFPGSEKAPPAGRRYHYENAAFPTLLTGISLLPRVADGPELSQRLSTYGYDDQGRAVLSVKGRPGHDRPQGPRWADSETGIEQVSLRYEAVPTGSFKGPGRQAGAVGRTVITNSLGQSTTYTYAVIAGEYRVLEVRGAGCFSCGETNVRYRHDGEGRVIEKASLDGKGKPAKIRRRHWDAFGRLLVEEIAERPESVAHSRVRYEYPSSPPGGDSQPFFEVSAVIRSSVVGGREHRLEVAYNEARQPVTIRETGWSPGSAGHAPRHLERTTRLEYHTINGRQVLRRLEARGASGALLSATDFRWDGRGDHVVSVVPQGLTAAFFERDGLGRIVRQGDGLGPWRHTTYSARFPLLAERIEQGGLTQRREYDALGHPRRIDDNSGQSVQMRWDLAGRLLAAADGRGYLQRFVHDTEGQVLAHQWLEPHQEAALRGEYFRWGPQGRPQWHLLPDGRVETWPEHPDGRPGGMIDGDDVRRTVLHGPEVSALLLQAPDGGLRMQFVGPGAASIQGPGLHQQLDDFGRVISVAGPDHGHRHMDYDEADRLVSIVDGAGLQSTFTYDEAGRLVARTTIPQRGALEQIHYRWRGRYLTVVEDPVQRTEFQRDDGGRVVGTTVTIDGHQWRTGTRYGTGDGQPQELLLAGGQMLLVTRSADGMPERVTLRSAFWGAVARWVPGFLHWLLPSETVADQITFHPFNGLTGLRHGNGITLTRQFDSAGRLIHLRHGADRPRDGSRPALFERRYEYEQGSRIVAEVSAQDVAESRRYRYDGFGQLKATASVAVGAWQRDTLGRTVAKGSQQYRYGSDGRITEVLDTSGRVIARYRYNAFGQRVAKTLSTSVGPVTTYFLWQGHQRVAEANDSGRITTQYLYLLEGAAPLPLALLDSRGGSTALLAIHADHRGMPVAMTDRKGELSWRLPPSVWGNGAAMAGAVTGGYGVGHGDQAGESARDVGHAPRLNLRLPGQYFDAETGLHENFHRYYDGGPGAAGGRGRYLTPDPLGYPDGPDPYAYAGNDPVNRVDPTGLYQIDMHYYMTFFLGLAAGLDPGIARTVALAAQYIDDNPDTRPIDTNEDGQETAWSAIRSTTGNQDRLRYYHFMADLSPKGADLASTGQISNLYGAAQKAPTLCAREVLFGEYLHALADTFSHQDSANQPYTATRLSGLGIGHGLDDSDPDFTFNHYGYPAVVSILDFGWLKGNATTTFWGTNLQRTVRGEEALLNAFGRAGSLLGGGVRPAASWSSISAVMVAFDNIGETEGATYRFDPANPGPAGQTVTAIPGGTPHDSVDAIDLSFEKKLAVLNEALKRMHINVDLTADVWGYNLVRAACNRRDALAGLQQADYPGTLLPKSATASQCTTGL